MFMFVNNYSFLKFAFKQQAIKIFWSEKHFLVEHIIYMKIDVSNDHFVYAFSYI